MHAQMYAMHYKVLCYTYEVDHTTQSELGPECCSFLKNMYGGSHTSQACPGRPSVIILDQEQTTNCIFYHDTAELTQAL